MPRWDNGFQTSEEIQRFKRYSVIREAARIMSRRGFHNTSLDEIAKVLGISKGTLYNYVKDKQEILFECHKIALDLGDIAHSYAQTQGGSGLDKLRNLLRCYIIWMNGQSGVGGVTFDVNALRPEDRVIIVERRNHMDSVLVSLLNESVEDRSAKVRDSRVTVYGIMTSINGISTWFAPDGRLGIDEVADTLLDLFTHSLSTDKSRLKPFAQTPDHPDSNPALRALGKPVPAKRTGDLQNN